MNQTERDQADNDGLTRLLENHPSKGDGIVEILLIAMQRATTLGDTEAEFKARATIELITGQYGLFGIYPNKLAVLP